MDLNSSKPVQKTGHKNCTENGLKQHIKWTKAEHKKLEILQIIEQKQKQTNAETGHKTSEQKPVENILKQHRILDKTLQKTEQKQQQKYAENRTKIDLNST